MINDDLPLFAQPEPEPEHRCPTCGRSTKLLPHRMDLSKCRMLMEVARRNANGHEWVKVQRDGNLIDPAESTIQADDVHALRLTWFGLLERQAPRTGLYRVTSLGIEFLRGRAMVPDRIFCRDGVVATASSDMVSIDDVQGVILDREYWDNYPNNEE